MLEYNSMWCLNLDEITQNLLNTASSFCPPFAKVVMYCTGYILPRHYLYTLQEMAYGQNGKVVHVFFFLPSFLPLLPEEK